MMRWYALGSLLSDVTEWTLGCLLPILSCLSPNKKLQQKPNCRFFVTYCNFGRNFTLCAKIVCVQISRVERRTCQLEGFYGEQYLSDSDTCATTAQPPQKLNLLDLNCKFSGRYLHQKNWKYCPPIRSANIYWWSSLLQQHLPTVPLLYISPICHHLLPVALLLLYIQSFSTLRQNWNCSQC